MKKSYITLFVCYILWGFQPLYWAFVHEVDSMTLLAVRIILAAIFSVLLLIASGRLGQLREYMTNRKTARFFLPSVLFILLDWLVYIIAVNNGHVLDVSLGYYISPLVIFMIGIIVYREKSTKAKTTALAIAALGVVVCVVSLGELPWLSLIISLNWSIYAAIKKNVTVDGVVSIAAETLLLTPLALVYIFFFKMGETVSAFELNGIVLMLSGVVTALPMFLYSSCVNKLPLTMMCFVQYLSPTFNLLCGLIMGEKFSKSQIISLAFFIVAIIVFTYSEIKQNKPEKSA